MSYWMKQSNNWTKSGDRVLEPTTHIMFVLDKSGSMGDIAREVIQGFNAWKRSVIESGQRVSFTLTLFDSIYQTVVENVRIEDVADADSTLYQPFGMTALFGAVGSSIERVENKMMPSDRALVVIMTDGQNNISDGRYTQSYVKNMIEARNLRENWTFTYLSADPNAFSDASNIGIHRGNTMRFNPTGIGTQSALDTVTASTQAYFSQGNTATRNFYEPEQEAQGE